jgi:hypothetical protein
MQNPVENQPLSDAHQQAVFQKAQELLRDRDVLARALSKEGMNYLNDNSTERYLEELADLIIADDADSFGRHLLNQVIHYVWAVAEQEVTRQHSSRTH